MRQVFTAALALAVLLPANASAQELETSRRIFNFLESWLDIAVVADAPGVLQVVRGARGRVEVAARAQNGIAGYGLGGDLTRRLDLTAVGAENAQYIVVVPEHVSVRILLPDGTSATVQSRETGATFRWQAPPPVLGAGGSGQFPVMDAAAPWADGYRAAAEAAHAAPAPTRVDGFLVAHTTRWLPSLVEIPDLSAVRTLDIRFEGDAFRIAASRPLHLEPGDRSRVELRLTGEPVDVVLYVPAADGPFAVHASGVPIAKLEAGQPQALCDGVVIQQPGAGRTWVTFHPQEGRLDCR